MVQSMPYPNCAPTWEYVAMPLGSLSEAPVISPGPSFSIRMSLLPAGLLAVGDADGVAATCSLLAGSAPSLERRSASRKRQRLAFFNGIPEEELQNPRATRTREFCAGHRPLSGLWGGLSLCAALVLSAPPLLRPACRSDRTFRRPS